MEPRTKSRRQRITISIDPQLLKWITGQVGVGKRFRSSAHAIEEAVAFYKQNGKL
jgi:Arc/MetJ-type ribon-helix-helix transcriptional regulator